MIRIAVLLALLSLPSHAADTKPAAPATGPATEATLSKLFEVTDMEKVMHSAAETISASMDARISSQLPNDKRKESFLSDLRGVRDDFQKKALAFSELKPSIVKIYQEVWTEDEAQSLVKFYESPVGKKSIREMPNQMQKTMKLTQSQVEKYAPEFAGKVQELVKKYYPELMKK